MPKQTRHSTAYSGVYFVELADEDQSYFIRYKKNGKSFEERAGRSSLGWNAEKASFLRKERLSGVNPLGRYSWNSVGQMDGENNWTFSGIFEAYLRLRPDLKGRENDIYRFRNYLKVDFGDRAPSKVVPDDIERFRHKLENQQLKPATVRHVLELLRRLANYACKKKFCQGLSFKIQMPTVKNQKTENLTQEELETLLRVLDDEPDKHVSNIVRLALYTGLRRGEMFGLKWNDIDFFGKTITIRSKKKERCTAIPMNEMAEKVLSEHAHAEAKSEFVFPGRDGKKRTECKRTLLRIKNNAGLPDDFRLLQGLRHVYASMLASSGEIDMATLQTLLTHKSPLMTQRYAHLREDALKDSDKKLDPDKISITQNAFEEKTPAYDKESSDQIWEVSQKNLVEDNFNSDEVEESVINNVSSEEDLKENQQGFISGHILESAESVKFEETVQAAGKPFEEELSEVAEDDQNTKIENQIDFDDADERLEENKHLEDSLTSTEAEFQVQEKLHAELDVDPIKMEVDMDEIVSLEELTEAAKVRQHTEFSDHSENDDYIAETLEENEHLQDGLAATAAEFQEHKKEYAELDVDPIKMEVDMDEIVSAQELIELTKELQVDETKAENKDSVIYEELTAGTKGVEENMEAETDSAEETSEKIEACESEFLEQNDVTKINDFTAENDESDNLDSEQQECKAFEIESDDFNQETETVDSEVAVEEETITSNTDESLDDEVIVEDSPGVLDFASEEVASTKGENNVKISENPEPINQSEQKSGRNNVFFSKTHQKSEKHNSLKDVKIDLELKTENKASVFNTDSSSRSSISELKKELISFSEHIKSTPAKVKISNEVQSS